jgi:hypothetical protein
MIRLVAFEQGGTTKTELDVEGAAVELNFQAVDMENVVGNRGAYSFNFQLPFTKTNNKFFEYFYEVNIQQNTWSHTTKTEVEIYDENTVLFRGDLQLLSVNTFKNKYEGIVLSRSSTFFQAIKGMTWRELFTESGVTSTDLDHALTFSNVQDSWTTTNDITSGGVGNGTIVYAMTDNAQVEDLGQSLPVWTYVNWWQGGTAVYGVGSSSTGQIRLNHLRPAILVRYLVNKIFEKVGYNYSSNFLAETHVDTLYMLLGTKSKEMISRALYGSKVGLTSDGTYTNLASYSLLSFTNESSPFHDVDALFSSGVFVAPHAGVFQLQVSLHITSASAVTMSYMQVAATVNNNAPYYQGTQQSADSGTDFNITQGWNLQLLEGDNVRFYFRYGSSGSGSSTVTVENDETTNVQLLNYSSPVTGIDLIANMPDCTVDEWLRAISRTYNLVFVPSLDNDKVIEVEPIMDYYGLSSTNKNWTNKVDIDRDIVLRPTTEETKKRITFKNKEGKDHRNTWHQQTYSLTKGEYRFDNDNDFAVGETVIGDFFAPLRVEQIPSWQVFGGEQYPMGETLLPEFFCIQLYDKDWLERESTTNAPYLMYYNGVKDVGSTIYIEDNAITQYPLFTHRSDDTATAKTTRWGHSYPDNLDYDFFQTYTDKNLFREYYAEYIEQFYSQDSRILECSAWLTPEDIRDFQYNDRIWIKDTYYRVLSISNYAVGVSRPSKLSLIKVFDTYKYDCDIVPDTYNEDGTIDFADPKTGAAATATEECCRAFGFAWNDSASECYWSGTDFGTTYPDDVHPTGTILPGNVTPQPVSPTGIGAVRSVSAGGLTTQTDSYTVQGTTNGAATVSLQDNFQRTAFALPREAIVTFDVELSCYQYGGSGGTVGDTTYALYRAVGTTTSTIGRITHNSTVDTQGTTRTFDYTFNNTNNSMQVSFDVTGANNTLLLWSATVRVTSTAVDTALLPTAGGDSAGYNGDATTIEIEFNGAGTNFMEFNG